MSEVIKTYRCPICKKLVTEDNKYRPFCSKHCADIDLGNWFNEAYKVPVVDLDEQELEELEKNKFAEKIKKILPRREKLICDYFN